MKTAKRIIAYLLALSIIFSVSALAVDASRFDYLEYPTEAISVWSDDILARISREDSYDANKGFDGTSLYTSPYWTLSVNGENVPLYATLSYDSEYNGVLSTYQYIFPKGDSFSLAISLAFDGEIKNAICLPEKEGVAVNIIDNTVNATIDHQGSFTILINDDDQRYAVTLFVKENRDDEASIAEYISTYGEENVAVYEKGYYELDELPLDSKVTYFCKGAFIKANHILDITSPEDEGKLDAFMYKNGADGCIVTGLGTFDFNSLDCRERSHFVANECKNSTFEGLIFLNPSSWTQTFYGCDNCNISDISIFGYRINSDGINICGCSNMTITNSFCRNGDDSFTVKTTNDIYTAHDITFSNCIGWSTKARCFGVIGEVCAEISDVEFTDCAVIYRGAVWNNDRISSLAVINEYGGCNIKNITFRNIEIYHDSGRPIIVAIWNDAFPEENNGCSIDNVVFENVNCKYAAESMKLTTQRDITKLGLTAAKINAFLIENGFTKLAVVRLFVKLLSNLYDTNYSIGAKLDNVVINGEKVNINKDIVREGNVLFG